MAQGDVKSDLQTLVAGGTFDIRPGMGEEWSVQNIYFNPGTVELYKTNGTLQLKFDGDSNFGGRLGTIFRLTNTQWLQIKNTGSASILVGYDGVQTK